MNRSKRLKTISHLKVAPIQIFSAGRAFDLLLPVLDIFRDNLLVLADGRDKVTSAQK